MWELLLDPKDFLKGGITWQDPEIPGEELLLYPMDCLGAGITRQDPDIPGMGLFLYPKDFLGGGITGSSCIQKFLERGCCSCPGILPLRGNFWGYNPSFFIPG